MTHGKFILLLPGYTAGAHPGADLSQAIDPDSSDYAGSSTMQQPHRQVPASFSFSEDLERQPWQSQLAHRLGLDASDGKRLPGARLGLIGDNAPLLPKELGSATEIVRADPIFLKADRDSATLIPAEQLELSEADAATISDRIFVFDYMMVSFMIVISILRINRRIAKRKWLDGVLSFVHIVIIPIVVLLMIFSVYQVSILQA